MFDVECVAKNFFDCCNLPICIFDYDFELLHSYGYKYSYEDMFKNLNLINDMKNNLINCSSCILNFKKNLNFLCIKSSKTINLNMSFLIGPFKTGFVDNSSPFIPFKSPTSMKYIEKLLMFIINENLNEKHGHVKYSLYVVKSLDYIEKNYSENISIDSLCKDLGINKSYFCSLFKKETGFTFVNYLNKYRVDKSKQLLENSNLSLMDISLEVGFNNQSYYSTVFKKFSNKSPLEFREEVLTNHI